MIPPSDIHMVVQQSPPLDDEQSVAKGIEFLLKIRWSKNYDFHNGRTLFCFLPDSLDTLALLSISWFTHTGDSNQPHCKGYYGETQMTKKGSEALSPTIDKKWKSEKQKTKQNRTKPTQVSLEANPLDPAESGADCSLQQ